MKQIYLWSLCLIYHDLFTLIHLRYNIFWCIQAHSRIYINFWDTCWVLITCLCFCSIMNCACSCLCFRIFYVFFLLIFQPDYWYLSWLIISLIWYHFQLCFICEKHDSVSTLFYMWEAWFRTCLIWFKILLCKHVLRLQLLFEEVQSWNVL